MNIVFILSDDHRWDWLGFMPEAPEFLETPNLDRLAREGAHLRNAFVSTSLCSPSRASILTGQYMHHHRVVDNQRPEPPDIRFFPEYLQAAGYETAFFGKWHMGHDRKLPRGLRVWHYPEAENPHCFCSCGAPPDELGPDHVDTECPVGPNPIN